MPTRRAVSTSVLAVAIAAVAVTGTATAVTAAGTHVHTCVSKSTGAIRVAKKCAHAETPLVLGTTGPRGLTGATGPSNVYEHRIPVGSAAVAVPVPTAGSTASLMPIAVPAGSYLITLTGQFFVGIETSADLSCSMDFKNPSTTTYGSGLGVFLSQPANYQSASEQEVETFTTPTIVSAYCSTNSGNSGGTAGVYSANLTALAVGHAQTAG